MKQSHDELEPIPIDSSAIESFLHESNVSFMFSHVCCMFYL